MHRFLLIVSCVFIISESFAQVNMISFEEYRNAQFTTSEISIEQKQALYPLYFNSPIIDEAEFRSQTNEFDLSKMQYTLRLSTNNKDVRKYQNRIYQDLKTEYFFELRQTEEDQLEDLYKAYLDFYFESQKINLRKQILPIYEDIITMLSKEDIDGELSIIDLIDVSKKRDKLEIQIQSDQQNLTIQKELNGTSSQSLVSVADLEKFIAFFIMTAGPDLVEAHNFEINKLENAYQLEKAERDKRLDFAQIRYQGDPEDMWREKVSIGLGFRFPHSSKNSLDMIELQIEKMIEEEKFKQEVLELQANKEERLATFMEQYENYYSVEKIINKLKKYEELTKSFKPQSKREIIDLLELNIDSIEEELNLINAQEDLYDSYIELAKSMGLLQDDLNNTKLNLLSPKLLEQIR